MLANDQFLEFQNKKHSKICYLFTKLKKKIVYIFKIK